MYKKSSVLIRNFSWSFLSIFFLAVVIGCAGMSTKSSECPDCLTGVFIDAPVAGLNYESPSAKGVTDTAGSFHYKQGEKVTFSIGKLLLGSGVGKPVMSPMDIVPDAKNTADQRVVNICAFLQTLDQDGKPENGITISSRTASFVNKYGSETNFNKHPRAFSFDPGFRSLLTELNEVDAFGELPRAVMSPKVAQKNLDDALAKLKK